MKMKVAVLVASLLFMAQSQPDATDQSGDECSGKTVNVFLDESFLYRGDLFSLPDTYVKMTIDKVTKMTGVVPNSQTAVFKQWFVFTEPQNNTLVVEVWDKDSGFNGKDDLMGKCQINLQKPVSKEKCTFENGDVSLSYMCI